MPGHDIIVVGASAGGVEAIAQLVSDLPPDLPAAIFAVLHIPSYSPSLLPRIINRAIEKRQKNSPLQSVHPQDGDKIESGRIYVAPPDLHLLVKNGYIRLARGPRENSCRPAIDPLFRTAARAYGQRVVGVVLSGTLDDGTAGLMAIKQRGGVAIVQDPDEALYLGMPQSAIENVEVDRILRVSDIARVLVELAHQPVAQKAEAVSSDMEMESDMAELELSAMQNFDRPGTPSPFACPECGGVLWELDEDKLVRFRCRTGHAFSIKSLLAKQNEGLEEALWSALRALEEKAALTKRMAKRAREHNQPYSTKRFTEEAEASQQQATLIREILLRGDSEIDLSTLNGELIRTKNLQENQETGNGSKHRAEEQRSRGAGEPKSRGEIPPPLSSSPTLPLSHSPSPLPFYVVAICASAGGLNALNQVLSGLPADFPAAIAIVQHLSPHHPSQLADILGRHIALQVKQAETGDVLSPGKVYVAPPDQHLLVNLDATLSLSHSKLVHFVRPSADLLLESVAASFKHQAIAVILTGSGSDGAMGIQAIKQMGGMAIAQDRETAEFFGMPAAAIDTGVVDLVLPLQQIAAHLVSLVTVKEQESFDS